MMDVDQPAPDRPEPGPGEEPDPIVVDLTDSEDQEADIIDAPPTRKPRSLTMTSDIFRRCPATSRESK
jgi:hypothetical protein